MEKVERDFYQDMLGSYYSGKKVQSILLSCGFHGMLFYSALTYGVERVNYGMAIPGSASSVNVELVASIPPAEADVVEIPQQVENITEPIKNAEIFVPKKPKEKIQKVAKVKTSDKKIEKSTAQQHDNLGSGSNTVPSNSNSTALDENSTGGTGQGTGAKVTDLQAAYLRNPPPTYPHKSRAAKEEGTVLLLVQIDTSGKVADISVKQTSGYFNLDKAALQAVNKWIFKPSKIAGIPVEDTVVVPIRFELKSV